MLEPGDILIDCSGSNSVLRDHVMPGFGGVKARTRSRLGSNTPSSSLPVRPAIRLQRVLQVLQKRENGLQVHSNGPPYILRRQHQPRDGYRQYQAEDYEAMPSDSTASGFAVTSPASPCRWTVSSTRSNMKPGRDTRRTGDYPYSFGPVPCSQCDQPAVAHSRAQRPPVRRSPIFLAGDSAIGSPYFQSISLGFECAMFLAGLIGQRDCHSGKCSTDMRSTFTSNGFASTCAAR